MIKYKQKGEYKKILNRRYIQRTRTDNIYAGDWSRRVEAGGYLYIIMFLMACQVKL